MGLKPLKTCLAALLAGALSVALIASADESGSEQEPGKKQEQTTDAPSGQSDRDAASPLPVTPAPAGTPKRTTQDFSPTEEISEDIAIPFPVDI